MSNIILPPDTYFEGLMGAQLAPLQPAPLTPFQVAHLGAITASSAHKITRDKSGKGWSQTALTFAAQIIHEHATGLPYSEFEGNIHTEFGKEHEEACLARLAAEYNGTIEESGVFSKVAGTILCFATPDAKMKVGKGKKAVRYTCEVKCPRKRHAAILLANEPPSDYRSQMLFQQIATGLDVSLFASYNPLYVHGGDFVAHVFAPTQEEREIFRDRLFAFEAFVLRQMQIHNIPILKKFL